MIDMDLNAPLTLACIDPEICADPAGNLFRLFLRMLAKAQNDFLAEVVPMVPGCTALVALSLGGNAVWLDTAPQTALLQLQRQHAMLEDLGDVKAHMLSGCLAQAGYRISECGPTLPRSNRASQRGSSPAPAMSTRTRTISASRPRHRSSSLLVRCCCATAIYHAL